MYFTPILWAKSAISLSLASSMATPTICSPCGPYFFCRSTSHGISILHGPHQVAQKFSNTALPRNEASGVALPSGMLFNSKTGATDPFGGSPAPCAGSGVPWPLAATLAALGGLLVRLPTRSNPVIATTTQRMTTTFRFKTVSSQSKAVQESQIAGKHGEMAGKDQHA